MTRAERREALLSDQPNCAQCGEPMPLFACFDADWAVEQGQQFGYQGNNVFCTMACGFAFARAAYKAGYRLVGK